MLERTKHDAVAAKEHFADKAVLVDRLLSLALAALGHLCPHLLDVLEHLCNTSAKLASCDMLRGRKDSPCWSDGRKPCSARATCGCFSTRSRSASCCAQTLGALREVCMKSSSCASVRGAIHGSVRDEVHVGAGMLRCCTRYVGRTLAKTAVEHVYGQRIRHCRLRVRRTLASAARDLVATGATSRAVSGSSTAHASQQSEEDGAHPWLISCSSSTRI